MKTKKSSLGRKSSLIRQSKTWSVEKTSLRFLTEIGNKPLVDSQKTRRSTLGVKRSRSSSDLDASCDNKDQPCRTIKKSKSCANVIINRFTSTPTSPTSSVKNNTDSTFNNSSKLQISEIRKRSSSSSGFNVKSVKKDSRPVTDKTFIYGAQRKVEVFFQSRAPELLENSKITPMTISLFVNLVNFLVAKHDQTMFINKSSMVNDVLNVCRILHYRGKAEKSWIQTVYNPSPQSWPYVISFLVWLVELYHVSEQLNPLQAMYPPNDDQDVDYTDLKLQLWVPHLLRGFSKASNDEDDSTEMQLFLNKYRKAIVIDENKVSQLQAELDSLQKELDESDDAEEERIFSELKTTYENLKLEIKNNEDQMSELHNLTFTLDEHYSQKLTMIEIYENRLVATKVNREKLENTVKYQEMSIEDKLKIETRSNALKTEIQTLSEEIACYKNVIYEVEIAQIKLESALYQMVQKYNRDIYSNLHIMPQLKTVEIDRDTKEELEKLDEKFKEIKLQLRAELRESEEKKTKMKIDLEKMEDESIAKQDYTNQLTNNYQKFETEFEKIKKSHYNDSRNTNKMVGEIEKKIENEKEKGKAISTSEEEEELKELRKKKEKFNEDFQEYVEKTSTSIKNRKRDIENTKKKLQKIQKDEMAYRKRRVTEILKSMEERQEMDISD